MPAEHSAQVLAQQVTLYGEPLASRFERLRRAYRIPQSRLAAVIGLSAPMLSQLASAQRVKISNPAVYARLLRLEEVAGSTDVLSGDPARITAALDDVAASRPQLTTEHGIDTRSVVVAHLARSATPNDLHEAASATRAPELAQLLHDAAEHLRSEAGAGHG